jgi:hypothetical protein
VPRADSCAAANDEKQSGNGSKKLRSDHARTKPVVVEKIKKRTQMKDYQQATALKEQRDIGRAKRDR